MLRSRHADNLIGIESAKSLAESICGIKTLEWVTVTEQLALPVGALKRNDLTTLDLGRQKMGSADAIILASLLRQNTSLEVLELACKRPSRLSHAPPLTPCIIARSLVPRPKSRPIFSGAFSRVQSGFV